MCNLRECHLPPPPAAAAAAAVDMGGRAEHEKRQLAETQAGMASEPAAVSPVAALTGSLAGRLAAPVQLGEARPSEEEEPAHLAARRYARRCMSVITFAYYRAIPSF